jgi:hypothetical protein
LTPPEKKEKKRGGLFGSRKGKAQDAPAAEAPAAAAAAAPAPAAADGAPAPAAVGGAPAAPIKRTSSLTKLAMAFGKKPSAGKAAAAAAADASTDAAGAAPAGPPGEASAAAPQQEGASPKGSSSLKKLTQSLNKRLTGGKDQVGARSPRGALMWVRCVSLRGPGPRNRCVAYARRW